MVLRVFLFFRLLKLTLVFQIKKADQLICLIYLIVQKFYWESQELCVLFFSLEPPNKEIKVLFYLLKYFAAISAVIGLAKSSQRTEGQFLTALLSHFGLRWYV